MPNTLPIVGGVFQVRSLDKTEDYGHYKLLMQALLEILKKHEGSVQRVVKYNGLLDME